MHLGMRLECPRMCPQKCPPKQILAPSHSDRRGLLTSESASHIEAYSPWSSTCTPTIPERIYREVERSPVQLWD
jgi:hypothetical protein